MIIRSLQTIGLLVGSNIFMTLAWYGHLKLRETGWLNGKGIFAVILLSWGLAFFEYCLQVPANRLGFNQNGGPFSLFQLKIIQEVITLAVFVVVAQLLFGTESLRWNHAAAFLCLIAAVFFAFKQA